MIELASNTTNAITQILHMADIHIRNGDLDRSRYEEYQHVMQRTLDYMDTLESVQNKEALTVIAGDLFHHKGRMDTPALKLYFWWMDALLARTPVILICGNHDYRQEDPKHPDMLETMVLPYAHRKTRHPLYYLSKTDHYTYANVGFGVMSIKDTLKAGNTHGIVQDLPVFPTASAFESEPSIAHTFALFHGTICQSSLPNEQRLSEMHGYPVDWFKGYECILLGDNHKQQIHTKPCKWGYPGSLIQQDYGEPTFGHGMITWDLKEKGAKARPLHIPNEYGMITVKWSEKEDGYVVVFGRRDVEPLNIAVQREHFPTTPKVRVIGTYEDEVRVRASFADMGVQPMHVFTTTSVEQVVEEEGCDTSTIHEKMTQLSDLNSPAYWIDYLAKVAPELDARAWLMQPESMKMEAETLDEAQKFLPTDLVQKLKDRNVRIQKAINEYYEELHAHQNRHAIILRHMSWDYAMCYGPGNYFDFERIDDTIALLNGRNAAGKSSFLDVLCIGLYGEPTKHRNMLSGKKMTAKMIHDQRPSHKSVMRVSIMFEMDTQLYEITRAFTTQKKEDHGVYAQLHNAQIFEVTPTKDKKRLLCEGSVAVEQWIGRHFGTLDDMLMSTILCQTDLTNFFYLKQDEQKKILDHALQLGSIAAFGKVLKEACLAHNEWLTLLRTSLQTIQSSSSCGWVTDAQIEAQTALVASLREQENVLDKESVELLTKVGVLDDLPDLDGKEVAKQRQKTLTALKKYEDIGDSDMETCLMVKGEQMSRYEALKKKLHMVAGECEGIDLMDELAAANALQHARENVENHIINEVKPDVSKSRLDAMRANLEAWKRQYPPAWSEAPDDLFEHAEGLKSMIVDLQAEEEMLMSKAVVQPSLVVEDSHKLPVSFSIREAERRLEQVQVRTQELKASMTTPQKSRDGYAAFKKEWLKWKHDIADVESLETADALEAKLDEYRVFYKEREARQKERDTLEEDLQKYEVELNEVRQIPFNPECWACVKQPFAVRQDHLAKYVKRTTTMLKRIRQYLEQCEQHGSLKEMLVELRTMEEHVAKRKYYERYVEKMEKEYEEWMASKAVWKQLERITEELEALEEEERGLSKDIACYQRKRWKSWQRALDETVSKRKELEEQYANMRKFLVEYDTREKDMITIQEEEDKWKSFENFEAVKTRLECELECAEKVSAYWVAYNEFSEMEKLIHAHGENIERIYAKKRLLDTLALLDRVTTYSSWKSTKSKMDAVRAQVQDALRELATMQAALHEQQHQQERVTWMETRLNEWARRKADLQLLDMKFIGDKQNGDGYKEWIYREKVVPLVATEVNRFLATIETIRLKITYDRKCFLYFLEDRGNTPTLDKASGYQNFVVGLAMRLALSRIGAAGQNVRHLFIDEGFTACDVGNIEKVPTLLQGVMAYGGYKSILIMSHLEQVQEAANVKIGIERKGVFSYIHSGTPYPSVEVEVAESSSATITKKRGRPKKTGD